ncbi:hypothetical protein CFHF_20620 [Caulobacter flavus]|jgi:hypothetical protein|uniref:Copper resistance protein D domain-containing protein n=1 Tax=Caulobacter flavus TaxID=1679497 RepID=A0A2N5CPG8_9CAUL|nr:hypothetical protein [Caulobacter flavus]AYV48439.1 hypothetical protein C1707_20450 [Caulobacter flavus]PLR08846.1 hypothetical protein CFHF_20620 [Caulobacter flavus]
MLLALITLLHVLVFVYWLGGDLGAFYTSRYAADPARTVKERGLALKVLADIDMAPRTCLILALPTGLTLAKLKSWWDVPPEGVAAVWALCLFWLTMAWTIHLHHSPPEAGVRRIDIAIRWGVLVALAGFGGASLVGLSTAPLFLALKMLILAVAIGCGLFIRKLLAPLGPPVAAMMTTGPTPEGDAVIAAVLEKTRPVVVSLWILLILAALLGLWTPA